MGLGTVSSIGSTGTWGREAAGWGQRPLPRLQRKHSLEQRVPRDLQWGELAGRGDPAAKSCGAFCRAAS